MRERVKGKEASNGTFTYLMKFSMSSIFLSLSLVKKRGTKSFVLFFFLRGVSNGIDIKMP